MQMDRQSGFTLVELVMVISILAIVAAVAVPRLFDKSDFEARGFYDQTMAVLRYAQKSAVAQRRTVCVDFSASGVSLTMASAAGATQCNSNLTGPTGDSPFAVAAQGAAAYDGTPSNFYFTSLGQASASQTIRVTGVAANIVVEGETGYVHP